VVAQLPSVVACFEHAVGDGDERVA